MRAWNDIVVEALRLVADRCPRIVRSCYWAGTSSVAIEELGHRRSLDLDLHTKKALQDVRPILAELHAAFPGAFCTIQVPDEFGSGFSGVLALSPDEKVTVEVLANFEDMPDHDLVPCRTVPKMKRISLRRYLAEKIQWVAERAEARDLVDIAAIRRNDASMEPTIRRFVAQQDPLLLVERLLSWSDEELARDLRGYPEVDPREAAVMRDLFLTWIRQDRGAGTSG